MLKERLIAAIAPVVHECIHIACGRADAPAHTRTMENTEYQAEAARPSKFAARALAWHEAGGFSYDDLVVYETHSYPGVLSTFYLALGAAVILNDPDDGLLSRVYEELSEGHGGAVRKQGEMTEARLIDFDPVGVPDLNEFIEAARTDAVLVVTDGSGINRKRNGPIPRFFRELAEAPEGRWESEMRSQEELWHAVARKVGRNVIRIVTKSGSAPAWYVILK